MGIEEIKFSLGFVQWVGITLIGVYSWLIGRQSASQKEMLGLQVRVAQLEEQIKHMPSQSELSAVMIKLSGLDASLAAMSNQFNSVNRRLDNMNEYLTNRKPGA